MVSIEPFRWIKSTALDERLQLANKLNEVIDVLNQYPVNIEDIDMSVSADGVFTFIFTLSDGTTKEMSFSMGDYINNLLTGYVSKTGVNEVTGDIRVPTTPTNPLSVVNSAYVNDSSVGVNNIVHKAGDEDIYGIKLHHAPLFVKEDNVINTIRPETDVYYAVIFQDSLGTSLFYYNTRIASDGTRDIMMQIPNNESGNNSEMSCVLILALAPDGTVSLRIDKTINGVYSSTPIAIL